MRKQVSILPALVSLFVISIACGKDSKKSPTEETDTVPAESPIQTVAPEQAPVLAVPADFKMVGLRFGSEYLTLRNEKIFNVDAQGNVQSEVLEIKQSLADANEVKETPVAARPRRIDSLNDEFFLLLQPEYNTCKLGPCDWTSGSIRPQSNFLVNKKNGDAWEIDSAFMPVPGTVKFVTNGRQKTVYFLAHDARDSRFWAYYPYDMHYASEVKDQLFVYGRKVLVAIDISRPEQKVLQPISGNLNVEDYEVDRHGNAVVHTRDVGYQNSTYMIARNGTQLVTSLVQDPDFKLKAARSYIFRDNAGDLYRYYVGVDYNTSYITKFEVSLSEGRAVAKVLKQLSVANLNSNGSDNAVVREDKESIYVAIKGEVLIFKKDFSEARTLTFSSNTYLPDLYLEVLPDQKVFVAGRYNQVLVASQIDLTTSTVKPIAVDSIEGKLANLQQKDGAVEMTTVDEATDTTLVYGFDSTLETFKLKDSKPGQVDDSLRILVKVSGPVSN